MLASFLGKVGKTAGYLGDALTLGPVWEEASGAEAVLVGRAPLTRLAQAVKELFCIYQLNLRKLYVVFNNFFEGHKALSTPL